VERWSFSLSNESEIANRSQKRALCGPFFIALGVSWLLYMYSAHVMCRSHKTLRIILNYWNFSLSIAIFAVLLLAQVSIVRRVVLVACE
jgi:hypothetical protein